MKRRSFLKSSVGLGATFLLDRGLAKSASTVEGEDSGQSNYRPRDKISEAAFILDREQKPHSLVELCEVEPKVKVNMLYVYGGGANTHPDRLGGIWCPDTFEDLHTLRFAHEKYGSNEVRIIPVACPPVYSSHYYGFDRRVFLDESDDSSTFKESVAAFIESTEVAISNKYIPLETYYDLRFRLLFNAREDLRPGDSYGQIFDWQGKFRAADETQKYGTPCIWLLDADGRILEEPLWGNLYHSKPFKIRYTVIDLDRAIERNL